jgi:hypothetical protein
VAVAEGAASPYPVMRVPLKEETLQWANRYRRFSQGSAGACQRWRRKLGASPPGTKPSRPGHQDGQAREPGGGREDHVCRAVRRGPDGRPGCARPHGGRSRPPAPATSVTPGGPSASGDAPSRCGRRRPRPCGTSPVTEAAAHSANSGTLSATGSDGSSSSRPCRARRRVCFLRHG